MPEYVRVTDEVKPRREYSVVASAVDPDVHKILDKPGAATDGTPFPPKYTPDEMSEATESLSSSSASADNAAAPSGRQAKTERKAD